MSASLGSPPIEIANRYKAAAPVDLFSMATEMGLDVKINPEMPEKVSGKIKRIRDWPEDRFAIELNGRHSLYRQRFTLAHEIMHYLLHQHLIGDEVVDDAMYRSDLSNEIEAQANREASELLMPAKLVRGLYAAGLRGIHPLTVALGASEEAVRIRLRQLRLGP